MRFTVKLNTNEWLFARNFVYIDGQNEPYIYKNSLLKRKGEYEPKSEDKMPYLIIDDVGMMINHINQQGKWMMWDWENTKSMRIYHLMHPWKASIYKWMHDADYYRERRKTKRYLRTMKWKYKGFKYNYEEQYNTQYSLILEGKKGNGQIWLPNRWVEEKSDSWLLEKIEEKSERSIKYFNTEEDWRIYMNKEK